MAVHTLVITNWRPVSLNRLIKAHWAKRSRLKRLDRDLVALHALAQGVPVEGLRGAGWTRSSWAVYHLLEDAS